MRASDISEIILWMKGKMPESMRATMAHKFLDRIGKGLMEHKGQEAVKQWADSGGPIKFMDDCHLDSGVAYVDPALDVPFHDTDLATFCNRWMNIEQFKDPEDGEWKPISTEMNQIRFTMVKELEALAAGQLEMGGIEELEDQSWLDIIRVEGDFEGTLREFFTELSKKVWEEGEGFSGKRPFGNSGWDWDVYRALVKYECVEGTINEDGDLEDVDEKAARAFIRDLLEEL